MKRLLSITATLVLMATFIAAPVRAESGAAAYDGQRGWRERALTGGDLIATMDPRGRAPVTQRRAQDRLLDSTGWVRNFEKNGSVSSGTCWVLDVKNRLVLTNSHVVKNHRDVRVLFPGYRDGQLMRGVPFYMTEGRQIRCRVLAVDTRRDLALLQLERVPPLVRSLRLAPSSPRQSETVYGIGNSSVTGGTLWNSFSGQVHRLKYYQQKQTSGRFHASLTVETNCPTFPGDSGAPLINRRGELVGVHFSNNGSGTSWAIDVQEVRNFLDRHADR